MHQNPQNKIRQKLQSYGICLQKPENFRNKKDKQGINLNGFHRKQNISIVDIDKEIERDKNLCQGRRCDLLLFIDFKCFLIEAKKGRADADALEQLNSTFRWLKLKGIVQDDGNVFFLMICQKINPTQRRAFMINKPSPSRIDWKQCIFKYLKDKDIL